MALKTSKFAESATNFAESGTVYAIHRQIINYVFSRLKQSWNPQIVSGIRINLWNTLTFAESAYICGIWNNQLDPLVAETASR